MIMWQCLLRFVIKSFLKTITKYGKKVEKILKMEFDKYKKCIYIKPVYGNDINT